MISVATLARIRPYAKSSAISRASRAISSPAPGRRRRRSRRRRGRRATLSRMRSASSGAVISGVSAWCGVMRHVGSLQSGWPSGSGSGSVTSMPAPAIVPSREGVDERVGVDEAAAGDVDQVGRRPSSPRTRRAEQVPCAAGEGGRDARRRRRPAAPSPSRSAAPCRTAPGTGSADRRTIGDVARRTARAAG